MKTLFQETFKNDTSCLAFKILTLFHPLLVDRVLCTDINDSIIKTIVGPWVQIDVDVTGYGHLCLGVTNRDMNSSLMVEEVALLDDDDYNEFIIPHMYFRVWRFDDDELSDHYHHWELHSEADRLRPKYTKIFEQHGYHKASQEDLKNLAKSEEVYNETV